MFYIKRPILIVTLIVIIISLLEVYKNKYIPSFFYDAQTVRITGTVISECVEKEYNYIYKIKTKEANFLLYIKKEKNRNLKTIKYGDLIELTGAYKSPSSERNYKGFSYKNYLKTQKIEGIIKTKNNEINILKNNNVNSILITANKVKNALIHNVKQILPDKTANLFVSILIGGTIELDEELKESFKESSLTHLLAVSGSHVVYILVRIRNCIKKIFNKQKTKKYNSNSGFNVFYINYRI